jgi:DNA adenine methylase
LVAHHLRGTYFEPFLGGGAVFFCLQPRKAILSDINGDLVGTYQAVQRNPTRLIRKLKAMPVSSEEYYRIRSEIPRGSLNQAARFLYLNRTAFGGIYRLNREGGFNVPFGGGERTPDVLWEQSLLSEASKALRSVMIKKSDFEPILDAAGDGDVVYCDPTYTVTHNANCFVRYNEKNFAWGDQERLAAAARRAVGRGAVVLVSNAHHTAIKALYPGAEAVTLERSSCVSKAPENRRKIDEFLFLLYPSSTRRR